MKLKWLVAVITLPLAVGYSGSSVALDEEQVTEQLETYKRQLDRLERRAARNKRANRSQETALERLAKRFRINGFFSTGLAQSDDELQFGSVTRISDDLNLQADSIVGIQMGFELSDTVDITTQLTSRLGDQQEVKAEWAYISWQLKPDLMFRAGRLRLPFYLNSEFIDVGFAYPWVRPPAEVYEVPLQNYEGVDFLYDFELGNWSARSQFFFGRPTEDDETFNLRFLLDDSYGVVLELSQGPWLLRSSYSRGSLTFEETDSTGETIKAANAAIQADPFNLPPILADGDDADYTAFGLRYDDGSWLAIAEIVRLRFYEGLTSGTDAHYLTVGKRFGKFMPYTSWQRTMPRSASRDRLGAAIDKVELEKAEIESDLNGLASLIQGLEGLQIAIAFEENNPGAVIPPSELQDFRDSLDPTIQSVQDVRNALADALLETEEGEEPSADAVRAAGIIQGDSSQLDIALLTDTFQQTYDDGLAQVSDVGDITGQITSTMTELKSWTLGARYELTPRMAFKVEYQRFYEIVNGGTIFADDGDTGSTPSGGVNMISVVFDAVW